LILPKDIGAKELFYNTSEAAQIDKLKPMLEEEKYHELVSRLQSKNLPVGLNVLLFGAPGTGKTETALQLARFSGRQLIKIDISKTKSMWFGESEKIVKKIFSDYKEYASSQDLAPILLFNEADAILSSRGNIGSSNTKQTENAIQNILLEELENFKGIFIATTNLVKNLDPAFDRRFLFKVEFSKPGIQQRSLIWQSKLDFITGSDAAILADSFELSGGQIDNVARKCEINFVLNGEVPNLDQLMNYCSEESVVSKGTKKAIGFNTSQSLN
jgi:SpoVK/Ycf46/Vps4 family AAA+-type ATPase